MTNCYQLHLDLLPEHKEVIEAIYVQFGDIFAHPQFASMDSPDLSLSAETGEDIAEYYMEYFNSELEKVITDKGYWWEWYNPAVIHLYKE